jgi:opine dehydrogenase
MKVAVLGGGHGCYAAAADLSEQGHEVRLWRRDTAQLQPLLDRPVMTLKDEAGEREIPIAKICADIGEAIAGADLVLIPSPAIAQEDIARAMAPHLTDGQVVFLPPGTFGSFIMSEIVRGTGNKADVSWAETGTLPWLARKHGDTVINITTRATRLPTGVYPARPCPGGDWQGVPQRGALRRCPVRRADECRPHHPPATDHDECRPAGAFPGLGYPQRRHPALGARGNNATGQ